MKFIMVLLAALVIAPIAFSRTTPLPPIDQGINWARLNNKANEAYFIPTVECGHAIMIVTQDGKKIRNDITGCIAWYKSRKTRKIVFCKQVALDAISGEYIVSKSIKCPIEGAA